MNKKIFISVITLVLFVFSINVNAEQSNNIYVFSDGSGYAILPEEIDKDIKINGYKINERYLKERQVLVWGEDTEVFYKSLNPRDKDFRHQEWRYLGYDFNGGKYANDDFPRDADSGREPWEKNMIENPWDRGLCPYNTLVKLYPEKAKETIKNILAHNDFPSNWDVTLALRYFYIQSLEGPGVAGLIRFFHIVY